MIIHIGKRSIFTRMVTTFILIIVPLYLLGFFIYNWAIKTVGSETSKTMLSQVEYYLSNIENQILSTKSLLYDCITDPDLLQLASIPQSLDEYDRAQAVISVEKRLVVISFASKYIRDVRAYIPAIDRAVKTAIGGYATGLNREEFQAVNEKTGEVVNAIHYLNGTAFVSVSYPSSPGSAEAGKTPKQPLFTLLAEFSREAIGSDLARQFSGSGAEGAILIDTRQNRIVARSGAEPTGGQIWDMLAKSPLTASGYQTVSLGDKRYLVMASRSGKLDLLLLAYVPESEVFHQINRYAVWFWVFTALALMLIVLYGFITYRQVKKPLVRLMQSFRKVEEGDMSIAIRHTRGDEFTYLYAGFNSMVEKLHLLIDQVYKQRILAQTAQLKQLQSQINPHFLYNSFFMLHRMVQAEDYENLSNVSEQLGNYFKYITRSAADNVALSDEVKHARIYAEIQAMRFCNRMRIDFDDLPEEFGSMMVPRLILQPLLENAIEHGMKDIEENGRIHVGFAADRDSLSIIVEDNGDGIGREMLEQLSGQMDADDGQVECTGVINIHRRIRMMFGPDSGLSIISREGGGVRAEIRLVRAAVDSAKTASPGGT